MDETTLAHTLHDLLPRLLPGVQKVLFNPPATIVFWLDGSKTVVKCIEGERFDRYAGFCAAVVKKLFGSTTAAKKALCRRDGRTENDVSRLGPDTLDRMNTEAFQAAFLGTPLGIAINLTELLVDDDKQEAGGDACKRCAH